MGDGKGTPVKRDREVAVVTGASGGIGGAVALDLAAGGFVVWAVGRRATALQRLAARRPVGEIRPVTCDLTNDDQVEALAATVASGGGPLFAVVHCAGTVIRSSIESASGSALRAQLDSNAAAAYALTRELLHQIQPGGTVVFMNSSQGLRAGAGSAAYAASKHALKAIADTLRQEVNERGIRVTSLYPGRVATPAQEALYAQAGDDYQPELLLQPETVARVVADIIGLPATAEITDLSIRPAMKSY